jgi:hypothetical protein
MTEGRCVSLKTWFWRMTQFSPRDRADPYPIHLISFAMVSSQCGLRHHYFGCCPINPPPRIIRVRYTTILGLGPEANNPSTPHPQRPRKQLSSAGSSFPGKQDSCHKLFAKVWGSPPRDMKRAVFGFWVAGGVAGQLTTSVNTLMPGTTVWITLDYMTLFLQFRLLLLFHRSRPILFYLSPLSI